MLLARTPRTTSSGTQTRICARTRSPAATLPPLGVSRRTLSRKDGREAQDAWLRAIRVTVRTPPPLPNPIVQLCQMLHKNPDTSLLLEPLMLTLALNPSGAPIALSAALQGPARGTA
jgi:hypothetical protein